MCVSTEGAEKRFNPARDLPPPKAGLHLFVCGPSSLMDAVAEGAKALGYASANIHREDFGADVDLTGDSFEVEARRSGKTVLVQSGQSIIDALSAAGIAVNVSCEEGVCGTCLTDILYGEADHRDQYLTDEEKAEGDLILLCCSRAKSPKLVLDI